MELFQSLTQLNWCCYLELFNVPTSESNKAKQLKPNPFLREILALECQLEEDPNKGLDRMKDDDDSL